MPELHSIKVVMEFGFNGDRPIKKTISLSPDSCAVKVTQNIRTELYYLLGKAFREAERDYARISA
jgi:hypothetical protein